MVWDVLIIGDSVFKQISIVVLVAADQLTAQPGRDDPLAGLDHRRRLLLSSGGGGDRSGPAALGLDWSHELLPVQRSPGRPGPGAGHWRQRLDGLVGVVDTSPGRKGRNT